MIQKPSGGGHPPDGLSARHSSLMKSRMAWGAVKEMAASRKRMRHSNIDPRTATWRSMTQLILYGTPYSEASSPPVTTRGHNRVMAADPTVYVTRPLNQETWNDFARLVEANNGVWGGCWCIGFHPEGISKGGTVERNRSLKQRHVENGTVHQILVYDGDECVGWCQYGSPSELPNIKNPGSYAKELVELPDWRIGCIFTGSRHRGRGVARAAVAAVLDAIGPQAAGSSRRTRSRLRTARRSVARTFTQGPNRCSRTSASSGTGG